MKNSFFKLAFVLAVILIAGGIAFNHYTGVQADQNDQAMTKEDVQEIVKQTIADNPEIIVEAFQKYQTQQREAQREQQREKFLENKDKLLENNNSPTIGAESPDAVTIVEFFDYNCGYCKRAIGAVNQIIEEEDDVRFVFKEFPILSASSETAARYALAAHEQGKYLEFHTALMEFKGQKNEESILKLASELDLDIEKLKEDAKSDKVSEELEETKALARELGVTGTPAFVIGDEFAPGYIPYEQMKGMIEKAKDQG